MCAHKPTLFELSSAEYVNAQELPTDMKSITDRAAQTLLWTELFRGELSENFFVPSHTKHQDWNIVRQLSFFFFLLY